MNDNSETTLRECIPWETHHETIFIDWADKASCFSWLHDKSYIKYSNKRNWYTIPVIVISTLTGTANFAMERVPEQYQDAFSIGIGSFNILAGIITTVSQFLKLNELTESHRVASIAWDKFHRSIRLELIKCPDERMDVSYFMKTSRDEFDRLMETCPPINKDIADLFRIELTKGKDKTEIARKIKNFNKLIKPEIFNELISIKDVLYKKPIPENNIELAERVKLARLSNERDNYKHLVNTVKDFITAFENKYSRHPSTDEICSNLSKIPKAEINVILQDIKEEP